MTKSWQIKFIVPFTLITVTLLITPLSSYDPVNLIKLIFLSIGGAMSSWALWINKKHLKSKEYSKITKIVIFYIIWTILSYVLSDVSKLDGLYGVFGRNLGLISTISLTLLLLLSAMVANNTSSTLISNTLIISGAISGAYGLIQSIGIDPFDWTTEYTPVFGFTGNPNFQSAFMATSAAASMIKIFEQKSLKKNTALLIVMILSIYNIYKTQSQQGFAILLAMISIGLYLLLRKKFRSKYYDLTFIALSIGAIALVLLDLFRKAPWKSIVYEESVSYRGDFWRAGWRMFISNPIFGVGPGGFRDNYMRYRDTTAAGRPMVDSITDSPHNYFINIASTGGLPLLIAYILINILVLLKIIKLLKSQLVMSNNLIIIIMCWIGFSLQSMISIEYLGLSVWGWALAGFIIGFRIDLNNNIDLTENKKYYIAVISLTLALSLTIPQFMNDTNFRTAVRVSDVSGIQSSGLNWPQDANRTNFVAKILRENGFESEGLKVARKAVEIYPENVESWREFSKFTSINMNERNSAERKILDLDPLGDRP